MEVRSDGFVYDGEFHVVGDDGLRYTRDSIQNINRFVRPRADATLMDEGVDYFRAQLKLYGLPVPEGRDKRAAKKLFLLALNQGILEVPRSLIDLEARMRSDWIADRRSATRAMSCKPSRRNVRKEGNNRGFSLGTPIENNSENVVVNDDSGTSSSSWTHRGHNDRHVETRVNSSPSKRMRENDEDSDSDSSPDPDIHAQSTHSKSRRKPLQKRDRGISKKELNNLAWSLPLPRTPSPSPSSSSNLHPAPASASSLAPSSSHVSSSRRSRHEE